MRLLGVRRGEKGESKIHDSIDFYVVFQRLVCNQRLFIKSSTNVNAEIQINATSKSIDSLKAIWICSLLEIFVHSPNVHHVFIGMDISSK